jgi:hypothetical protein
VERLVQRVASYNREQDIDTEGLMSSLVARDFFSGALGVVLVLASGVNAWAVQGECIGHFIQPGAGLACIPVNCSTGCSGGSGSGTITISWNPPTYLYNQAYTYCACNGIQQVCCHIVSYDSGSGAQFGTRGICNEDDCWGGTTCVAIDNGSGDNHDWGVWCQE